MTVLDRLFRRKNKPAKGPASVVEVTEPGQIAALAGNASEVSFTISDSFWRKWDEDAAADCAERGHRHGNAGRCARCGVDLT